MEMCPEPLNLPFQTLDMASNTKQVRELIGENEIEQAIGLLLDYFENGTEYDLLDQTILQKSRWADYKRKNLGGFGDEKESNAIRLSLLDITREADQRSVQPKTQYNNPPENRGNNQPPPPPPPPPKYVAQCYFNGDPNAYYVTPTNQIVMVNPMTNFTMVVASRTASMNPAFAWVYMFPNGFFYSIDHAGAIWGVNAFGMPVQMGYVSGLTGI